MKELLVYEYAVGRSVFVSCARARVARADVPVFRAPGPS